MREAAAYLLLILFTLYAFAFSPVLLWMKNEIRCDMKEKGASLVSQSKLLTLSEKEYKAIQWTDDSEFMMNGKMYDLIETERAGNGAYILKIVSDDKETEVMEMLDEDQAAKSSDGKHIQILIHFFSLYLSSLSSFSLNTDEQQVKPAFTHIVSFTFPDFDKISPPPRA